MTNGWRIVPMLAEAVDDTRALKVVEAGTHWVEQKLDGTRLLIHVHNDKILAVNRKGEHTEVKASISDAFRSFSGEWAFDGELVGQEFWVFDMPRALDQIELTSPYQLRRDTLESLWDRLSWPESVKLLPTTRTAAEGLELALSVRKAGGEGVVIKSPLEGYQPGKRALMKWKFWKSIDCLVREKFREGKESMEVGVVDPDTSEIINVGSVKMTVAQLGALEINDVVEVRYLYANDPAAPRLYQPNFLRQRDDKNPQDCTIDQLEYTDKGVL